MNKELWQQFLEEYFETYPSLQTELRTYVAIALAVYDFQDWINRQGRLEADVFCCDFCNALLLPGKDEIINTAHITKGIVTLCRNCYNQAGNDVR